MGEIGKYQTTYNVKNYGLPTAKPQRSHPYFHEKIWTLQEQIFKKLNIIAELLLNLYPKLTDNFSINIKGVIETNLKTLIDDLEFLQSGLNKDPSTFHTSKLNTNQKHIDEMKHVCDTLQTVSSYEYEFKNLGKIKHALHELGHLIQPSHFDTILKETQDRIERSDKAAAKKTSIRTAKKTTKAKVAVKTKKKKTVKPKDNKMNKLAKPAKKATKTAAKKKAPAKRAKPAVKKTVKAKAPAKKKTVKKAAPKKAAAKKKAAK